MLQENKLRPKLGHSLESTMKITKKVNKKLVTTCPILRLTKNITYNKLKSKIQFILNLTFHFSPHNVITIAGCVNQATDTAYNVASNSKITLRQNFLTCIVMLHLLSCSHVTFAFDHHVVKQLYKNVAGCNSLLN